MIKSILLFITLAIGSIFYYLHRNQEPGPIIPSGVDLDIQALWEQWKNTYDVSYPDREEEARKVLVFTENAVKIAYWNYQEHNSTLALNRFADLTEKEFQEKYTEKIETLDLEELKQDPHCFNYNEDGATIRNQKQNSNPPKEIDWRTRGAVTPSQFQGSKCSSSWAFSSTGGLEGLHAIQKGILQTYSEQQLIDCDSRSLGCEGGRPANAFAYTLDKGIMTERWYPYVGFEQVFCNYQAHHAVKVNNLYGVVVPLDSEELKKAVAEGPVSAAVQATSEVFRFYHEGVIDMNCGDIPNQFVLIVGYTKVDGQDVWIIKNSYGQQWGERGFAYLAREPGTENFGVCGILRAGSTFPVNQSKK